MARSAIGNLGAFLDMLGMSEGTRTVHGSDDGYNVQVGGDLFKSYFDHPRTLVVLNKAGLKSTAAGRYQLLAKYFDYYKSLLHLDVKEIYPDGAFSPKAQDMIAIQQIKECRAIDDIAAGRLQAAISKCDHIWASLPGAGYGQRENYLDDLKKWYVDAGGVLG